MSRPIESTESSLGGIGADLSRESGRKDKSKEGKRGKKMKVGRCAKLYTTSIIYNLSQSNSNNDNPIVTITFHSVYFLHKKKKFKSRWKCTVWWFDRK